MFVIYDALQKSHDFDDKWGSEPFTIANFNV